MTFVYGVLFGFGVGVYVTQNYYVPDIKYIARHAYVVFQKFEKTARKEKEKEKESDSKK